MARAREGKEMQHSFEELGFLDWNNHCGRKTRLKIATRCSDAAQGNNSSTFCRGMLILGHGKCTRSLGIRDLAVDFKEFDS